MAACHTDLLSATNCALFRKLTFVPMAALPQKPPLCASATAVEGGVTRCSVKSGLPVNTTLSRQLTYLQQHTVKH